MILALFFHTECSIITSPPEGVARYCFNPVYLSVCVSVYLSVCVSGQYLVFYFSAIRRYIDLKFIQDTYRVVLYTQNIDLHRSKVKVTGTVHCFLKVQSYHKNWVIEKFKLFFIDTVQITFIFIDFRACDFAFAFKTQNAPCVSRFIFRHISICVLNANETFVWLVNAFDASHIAHYSLKWLCPLHRILSLKWIWPAVSETKTETETKPTQRSQISDQNLRKEANAKCAVSVHAKRVSNS